MTIVCHTCRRPLDIAGDPMSLDCGGDCWGCVGLAEADFDAPLADDHRIGLEIAQGWRDDNGEAKPQAFFIANPAKPL